MNKAWVAVAIGGTAAEFLAILWAMWKTRSDRPAKVTKSKPWPRRSKRYASLLGKD